MRDPLRKKKRCGTKPSAITIQIGIPCASRDNSFFMLIPEIDKAIKHRYAELMSMAVNRILGEEPDERLNNHIRKLE
jgi:hypothetical protein